MKLNSTNCPFCQTPNPPHVPFCRHCGKPPQLATSQDQTLVMPPTTVSGRTQGLPPNTGKTLTLPTQPGRSLSEALTRSVTQRLRQTFKTQVLNSSSTAAVNRTNQREHTILIIDHSGSMAEMFDGSITKQQAANQAAVNTLLQKAAIDPQDQIGIVIFNETAEVLLPPLPIAGHKPRMIQILQSITPDDGTDIDTGLVAGSNLIDWNRSDVVWRNILLTDGHGGYPLRTAQDTKNRGGVIDVVGIGPDPSSVDEPLLKKVASSIGGVLHYRFIKDYRTLLTHYTQLGNKTVTY